MYVHISSFKIKKGEEETFIQMQRFEEKKDAEPAGLSHFHIFKDRNTPGQYWLLEYWNSKEDRQTLEAKEDFKIFHEMRDSILEENEKIYECDMIV